jgi:hypothetical protein
MDELKKSFFWENSPGSNQKSVPVPETKHAICFVQVASPRAHAAARHRQTQPFLVLPQGFFGAHSIRNVAE